MLQECLCSIKEKKMALGRKKEDHSHADLEAEVAALKKELKSKKSGGADPRVDKIIEALKMKEGDELPKKERFANYRKAGEIIKSL